MTLFEKCKLVARKPKSSLYNFTMTNMPYSFLTRVAKKKPLFPGLIQIIPTYLCNLHCHFCIFGEVVNKHDEMNKELRQIIDKTLIEKLMHEIGPYGPAVYFTGGEPLVAADILFTVAQINKNEDYGLVLGFTTNGQLLEKYAEDIVKNEFDLVCVSIDGYEDFHDKGRGLKDSYKKALAGVDALIAARNKTRYKLPLIRLKCVLNPTAIEQAEHVDTLAKKYDLDVEYALLAGTTLQEQKAMEIYFKKNNVAFQKTIGATDSDLYSAEEIKRTQEFLKDKQCAWFIKKSDIPLFFTNKTVGKESFCHASMRRAYIMPDGAITSCEYPYFSFGNMKEQHFTDIWFGEKHKAYLQRITNERVFPFCVKCCQLKYSY